MIGLDKVSAEGRQRVYRILCNLAHCDGGIARQERELLDRWRAEMGLTEAEAKTLEAEGREGRSLAVGDDPDERAFLLRYMVQVVAGDRVLADSESQRLKSLADEIGLDPARVAEAVMDRLMGPPR